MLVTSSNRVWLAKRVENKKVGTWQCTFFSFAGTSSQTIQMDFSAFGDLVRKNQASAPPPGDVRGTAPLSSMNA